jgi:hypothetical protein
MMDIESVQIEPEQEMMNFLTSSERIPRRLNSQFDTVLPAAEFRIYSAVLPRDLEQQEDAWRNNYQFNPNVVGRTIPASANSNCRYYSLECVPGEPYNYVLMESSNCGYDYLNTNIKYKHNVGFGGMIWLELDPNGKYYTRDELMTLVDKISNFNKVHENWYWEAVDRDRAEHYDQGFNDYD